MDTLNPRLILRFRNIERVASRKLLMLQAATQLDAPMVLLGNQLESLKMNRRDQWRGQACIVALF